MNRFFQPLAMAAGLGVLAAAVSADEAPSGQAAVVPGTGGSAPKDHPAADGWETEALAEAVGAQLATLKKHLVARTLTREVLETLVTRDVGGSVLAPGKLEAIYTDGVLTVARGECGGDRTPGPAALAGALSALCAEEAGFAALKVIAIEATRDGAVTTLDFEWNAPIPGGGHRQVNATWSAVWAGREAPRLRSLRVDDFEECRSARSTLFPEITESLMRGQPSWRAHLLRGVDHWAARVESVLGHETTAWNGVTLGDVNGDGWDDLYLPQTGGLPNRLFLRQPDGTFADASAGSGTDWLDPSHAALLVDFDNDGDQDLAVSMNDGVLFQENDGTGKFKVRLARLTPAGHPYGLAAADYDDDGDLDLYVACYHRRAGVTKNFVFARPVPYHEATNGAPNLLLRNEGGWRFTDRTKALGLDVNNMRYSYAPAWQDFDGDGDLDLYVANDFGSNTLYRQDRTPDGLIRFAEVAAKAGVTDTAAGMSACWGDYDTDGWPDLYVSNMFSSAGNRIAFQGRFHSDADEATRRLFQRHARGNSLFRNAGDGTFDDVSGAAHVTFGRWAWGSRFLDLNNDGAPDLCVANGFITQDDEHDL
ncbi:MAG: FG-GAP repeat domain-containing protein [Verrucomicrobiales bacterium]